MKKGFKQILKQIPKKGIPVILFVLVTCIFLYAIGFRIKAESMGSGLGTGTGSLVGRAIGSLDGLTRGRAEGTEAGRTEGLSAEDTEATIANELKQANNLEVLVASVKLSNFHTIGKDVDYAALYLVNGNVVFTVDMSQAEIVKKDDGLHVTLPSPKGSLYVDESTIKRVAEYQRKFFNGSAEDGFDAYLNTMREVQEATEENLNNYDTLVTSAKEAAENQIGLLVQSASTVSKEVHVDFMD